MLAVFAFGANAHAWEIDMAHSEMGFTVKHMVVAKVNGKFRDFSGTVSFDENNVSDTKISGIIQTASIFTDNEKRDGHLKGPDFFDVEQYPEIKFESKKVVMEDDNHVVVGDLTMRGVTKEIRISMDLSGPIKDPWGATRLGIEGHANINRQDFGIKWNNTMDNGGLVVSDDVVLNLHVELVKK